MVAVKEYKQGNSDFLLAACDFDLLGKTFKDEKKGLVLECRKSFYHSRKITLDEFSALLKKATIANLVGEKTVGMAIELGLAKENSVMRIQKVPHVQIILSLSKTAD